MKYVYYIMCTFPKAAGVILYTCATSLRCEHWQSFSRFLSAKTFNSQASDFHRVSKAPDLLQVEIRNGIALRRTSLAAGDHVQCGERPSTPKACRLDCAIRSPKCRALHTKRAWRPSWFSADDEKPLPLCKRPATKVMVSFQCLPLRYRHDS